MIETMKDWYHRYLSDTEAVVLTHILIFTIAVYYLFGDILTPVFASALIAYLLATPVQYLRGKGLPGWLSAVLVYLVFIAVLFVSLVVLVPMLWEQLENLLGELPDMVVGLQEQILQLPEQYRQMLSTFTIEKVIGQFGSELTSVGQVLISFSIASIPNIFMFFVYFVLVPMLVFFFLIDSQKITQWIQSKMPEKTHKLGLIYRDVNKQIGNYIRGKFIEFLIVSVVSTLAFSIIGLNYSVLLGFAVGASVVIPIVGAVIVTIPVVVVGLLQWGLTGTFITLMITYSIINLLDAYVLVPVLFSGAVNIHPIIIIVSILFFGSLLGFWGVLLAIPLAIVLKAFAQHWPVRES